MNPVLRYAIVYGGIAGAAIIATILLLFVSAGHTHGSGSMFLGYLVMLMGLTMIFVGVKRYRDVEKGGVIRFWPALGVGLAIAAVAALLYVLLWEAYLAATGYKFLDEYIASTIAAYRAEGMPADELTAQIAMMSQMRDWYANPVLRLLLTLTEIAPVALIVPLISAALLRMPKFLPARVKTDEEEGEANVSKSA